MSDRHRVLPDRLQFLVRNLGISQAEAARRAGLGQRAFNHYCRGGRSPSEEEIHKICKALRTHPNYLLGYDDRPFREN